MALLTLLVNITKVWTNICRAVVKSSLNKVFKPIKALMYYWPGYFKSSLSDTKWTLLQERQFAENKKLSLFWPQVFDFLKWSNTYNVKLDKINLIYTESRASNSNINETTSMSFIDVRVAELCFSIKKEFFSKKKETQFF